MVSATDATIHGARYATRWLSSAPVPPPYREPSTCRVTTAPASANTPAAAATGTSDSHVAATTWRPARSGDSPSRANGAVVTSASEVAVSETKNAAIRYAYANVVCAPVATPDAKYEPMTNRPCRATGSVTPSASWTSRDHGA